MTSASYAQTSQASKYFSRLVTVIGVIMVAYMGAVQLPQAIETRNWISATATVAESKLIVENDGPDGSSCTFARVDFHYAAAGNDYRGRWEPRKSLCMWGMPRWVIDTYPQGTQFVIYHTPDDPRKFVVKRGITLEIMAYCVIAVSTLAIGIALHIRQLRQISAAK